MGASRFGSLLNSQLFLSIISTGWNKLLTFRRWVQEVGNRKRNHNTVCYWTQVGFPKITVTNLLIWWLQNKFCKYWLKFIFLFSATPGGVLDRAVDAEDEQHKDFLRLVCYCISVTYLTCFLLSSNGKKIILLSCSYLYILIVIAVHV